MFLDILQILAICSNRLSSAAFSSLSPSGKKEKAMLWSGYPEPGSTALIVQILLHFLKNRYRIHAFRIFLTSLTTF